MISRHSVQLRERRQGEIGEQAAFAHGLTCDGSQLLQAVDIFRYRPMIRYSCSGSESVTAPRNPRVIHKAAFYVVSHPAVLFIALLGARMIFFWGWERLQPAREVPYRSVVWRDIVAGAVFSFAIVPVADIADRFLAVRPVLPAAVLAWPLAARFALYVVIADLGQYWVHRLLHTRYLWRVHKWHHSPTYLYWLAGIRGSLLQQIVYNLPFVLAGVLLDIAPWWMAAVIVTKSALQNDWMHLNVPFGSKWIEWFVITPRYHHIHHSDDPRHYRNNLAALFPIWDRLFGTYVNPDEVPRNLSFGIAEHVPAIRLAIGV